jgi:dipeptidyl aminopeptidase/acylaminoacyl peptidase
MRSDGSQVTRLLPADSVVYLALLEEQRRSPDGKARVYAEAEGGPSEPTNLFIFRDDLPEDWIRRWVLVDHGKHAYDPAWSPDGERIVFVSELTNNDEIWVINADGSGEVQLTYNDWEWDKFPTWSPDGSQIAFWTNRVTGRKQIWVMNADGSDQHNISNNEYNDWQPMWIAPELLLRVEEGIAEARAARDAALSSDK